MIDGNAIFDNEGIADLGSGFVLVRQPDGQYALAGAILSQDEVYNLGLALARLADVQFSGPRETAQITFREGGE